MRRDPNIDPRRYMPTALLMVAPAAQRNHEAAKVLYESVEGHPEGLLSVVSRITSVFQDYVFRDLNTYDYDPEIMATNLLKHPHPIGNVSSYLDNSELSLKLLLTLKTILEIINLDIRDHKAISDLICDFIRYSDQDLISRLNNQSTSQTRINNSTNRIPDMGQSASI